MVQMATEGFSNPNDQIHSKLQEKTTDSWAVDTAL